LPHTHAPNKPSTHITPTPLILVLFLPNPRHPSASPPYINLFLLHARNAPTAIPLRILPLIVFQVGQAGTSEAALDVEVAGMVSLQSNEYV